MDAQKVLDKLEKFHEKFELLELESGDPNESEFNTCKADILMALTEMEELAGNSIEQAAIHSDNGTESEEE